MALEVLAAQRAGVLLAEIGRLVSTDPAAAAGCGVGDLLFAATHPHVQLMLCHEQMFASAGVSVHTTNLW